MDLNTDDILNVEIDPLLLKSYEKLSLEDVFPEEISKNDDLSDFKNILPYEDIATCKDHKKNADKEKTKDVFLTDDVLCGVKNKKTYRNKQKVLSDINGNESSETIEHLNNRFTKLEISSAEEEDETTISKLKERAPIRSVRRRKRRPQENNYFGRTTADVSDVDRERLLHLSGSNCRQLDGATPVNNLLIDDFSVIPNGIEPVENSCANSIYNGFIENSANNYYIPSEIFSAAGNELPVYQDSVASSLNVSESSQNESSIPIPVFNDSSYEDSAFDSVYSPTNSISSGYETSSPQSISSSPPKYLVYNHEPSLDLLAVTVDEQDILDIVVELESITNYTSTVNNLLSTDFDDKEYKEKILDYLKDAHKEVETLPQPESSDACSANVLLNNICPAKTQRSLPQPESSDACSANVLLNNICPAKTQRSLHQNNSNPPIEFVPLKDTAKTRLRKSLSFDRFHALQDELYHRINEACQKNEKLKVIFVEGEDEKTSENQTNLHLAVLNSDIEKIYCLVEIHKQYVKGSFLELSLRDKHGKTVLDYAIQKELTLVVDYLKENHAQPSLNI